MSVIIKGYVSVSYTYTGNNGKFEYTLDDLGVAQGDWDGWSEEERQTFLDEILDVEIGNKLDAGIWYGEEE